MILAITEINAWEHERWTYILDLLAQDADTVNKLYMFAKAADTLFKEASASRKRASDLFAASKYWIRLYDSVEPHERNGGFVRLCNKKGRTSLQVNVDPQNGGYKGNYLLLDTVLSPLKVKQAWTAIVKKKENLCYKNVEFLFLKTKSTKR